MQRRPPRVLAALLLSLAGLAAAQEPDPFVGHFVDAATGQAELLLVPTREGALEGALCTADGGVFEVRALPRGEIAEGRSVARDGAGEDGAFTARVVPDALILARGGEEVRFERVPGSSRDVAELRGVLAKLLPPLTPAELEEAAIGALKRLVREQAAFRAQDDDGDGVDDFGALAELLAAGRVDADLARGERRGYRFALRSAGEGEDARWMATASPVEPGKRCFVVTQGGAIFVTKAPAALTDDCVVPPGAMRLGARAPQDGPDLSHVRAGQRYRYLLRNPGAPDMFMEYRVLAVEGRTVKYEITTIMDMGQGLAPVGPPTPQEWTYQPPPPGEVPGGGPKVELRRESVTISGVTFDCMVTTVDGTSAWVPATGDVPTFPGIVRVTTDGKVTMELVAIGQ